MLDSSKRGNTSAAETTLEPTWTDRRRRVYFLSTRALRVRATDSVLSVFRHRRFTVVNTSQCFFVVHKYESMFFVVHNRSSYVRWVTPSVITTVRYVFKGVFSRF